MTVDTRIRPLRMLANLLFSAEPYDLACVSVPGHSRRGPPLAPAAGTV
ncbi:MAG: hypothetical protein MZV63_36105 [Marinilabiliales bacterium]|nr:hypothetical protein [Marinilabiliales bacterium]